MPPRASFKANSVEHYLPLQEANRVFLDIERVSNGLLDAVAGNPWQNAFIEGSMTAALTATDGDLAEWSSNVLIDSGLAKATVIRYTTALTAGYIPVADGSNSLVNSGIVTSISGGTVSAGPSGGPTIEFVPSPSQINLLATQIQWDTQAGSPSTPVGEIYADAVVAHFGSEYVRLQAEPGEGFVGIRLQNGALLTGVSDPAANTEAVPRLWLTDRFLGKPYDPVLSVSSTPASPIAGRYLIDPNQAASGAWAGHEGEIADGSSGSWVYTSVTTWRIVRDTSTGNWLQFNASGGTYDDLGEAVSISHWGAAQAALVMDGNPITGLDAPVLTTEPVDFGSFTTHDHAGATSKTWSTEAEWETGTQSGTDTNTSSGDVLLSQLTQNTLVLNATNEFATRTIGTEYDPSNSKFFVRGWFKPSTTVTNGGLFYIGSHGSTQGTIACGFFNGSSMRPTFRLNNLAVSLQSGTTLSTGTWYYIEFNYDQSLGSNNMKIFINGALDTQGNYTGTISSMTGLKSIIGSYYASGFTAQGEYFGWEYGKENAGNQTTYTPAFQPTPGSGCVSMWQMDEGTGTTLDDSVGTYDLSTSGSTSWSTTNYYSTTSGTDTIQYDTGSTSVFGTVSWSATTPAGTTIRARTRTASSQGGLASASWSSYYTVSGSAITSASDRWLEIEWNLTTTDYAQTPTLASGVVTYSDGSQGAQIPETGQILSDVTTQDRTPSKHGYMPKNYITTGTAAPATTPEGIGYIFVDTTNSKVYVSKGTSSSSDWLVLN